METRVPARLTPREGRQFGLTVGAAFLALAAVAAWRAHPLEARGFGVLGGALVLAALVVPAYLGPARRSWLALGHAISSVTTPVFLGIVYFVLLTPTGLLRRLVGHRLGRPRSASTFWVARATEARRRVDMERQF